GAVPRPAGGERAGAERDRLARVVEGVNTGRERHGQVVGDPLGSDVAERPRRVDVQGGRGDDGQHHVVAGAAVGGDAVVDAVDLGDAVLRQAGEVARDGVGAVVIDEDERGPDGRQEGGVQVQRGVGEVHRAVDVDLVVLRAGDAGEIDGQAAAGAE